MARSDKGVGEVISDHQCMHPDRKIEALRSEVMEGHRACLKTPFQFLSKQNSFS